jgi:hypothetical protein
VIERSDDSELGVPSSFCCALVEAADSVTEHTKVQVEPSVCSKMPQNDLPVWPRQLRIRWNLIGFPRRSSQKTRRENLLKASSYQVTNCLLPTGQTLFSFGLVMCGEKTSLRSSGEAHTRENKNETNKTVNANIVRVVEGGSRDVEPRSKGETVKEGTCWDSRSVYVAGRLENHHMIGTY